MTMFLCILEDSILLCAAKLCSSSLCGRQSAPKLVFITIASHMHPQSQQMSLECVNRMFLNIPKLRAISYQRESPKGGTDDGK